MKKKSTYITDKQQLAALAQAIVRKVKKEEDPYELNAYKKFIRTHVSVFSRAYFTAYLLKHVAAHPDKQLLSTLEKDRADTHNNSKVKTLYMNIGKSSRVQPKDIITLLTSTEGVTQNNIKYMKILELYSFVDVHADLAKRIIQVHNGTEYRGRKLHISFARSKRYATR